MKFDQEVDREPIQATLENDLLDLDETFNFQPTLTTEQAKACERIQKICRQAASEIIMCVPEGRERSIAVNNILSAALMAQHGIQKRSVVVVAISEPPSPESSAVPTGDGI